MLYIKQIIQNILIIEDEQTARRIIQHALSHKFPDFISATVVISFAKTIEEAQQLIADGGPFDMITLDGNIVNKTALDLFPILEEHGYLSKVIMLPGTPSEWKEACDKKGIPILPKMEIETIPPNQLFQMAA
ncbi:hypothetical protein KBC03_00165 [Patescibacteria group bacterium]|nr:hypothetical protein [Patescibacteria group bacterium]